MQVKYQCLHGESLASAGLTVREDGAVVALGDSLDERERDVEVQLVVGRVAVVRAVEREDLGRRVGVARDGALPGRRVDVDHVATLQLLLAPTHRPTLHHHLHRLAHRAAHSASLGVPFRADRDGGVRQSRGADDVERLRRQRRFQLRRRSTISTGYHGESFV